MQGELLVVGATRRTEIADDTIILRGDDERAFFSIFFSFWA